MSSPSPRDAVIAELQGRLDAVAEPATKAWFEHYLKHAIGYRGVKTPVVTRIVGEWRRERGLGRLPVGEQLWLARSLIEESHSRPRWCGGIRGTCRGMRGTRRGSGVGGRPA